MVVKKCTTKMIGKVVCIVLGVLFAATMECAVFAEENDVSDTEVSWHFDMEESGFVIENTDNLSPYEETLHCIAAVFSEDGQLLSCNMAEREENNTVLVEYEIEDLPQICELRFFFLNEDFQPLSIPLAYEVITTEPACTRNGSIKALAKDGQYAQNLCVIPAIGHDFQYEVIQEPVNVVDCGYQLRTCLNCTHTETMVLYPEIDIARLCMYGDLTGIGKKAEVPITVSFEGEGHEFDCYALLKYQGHTSLVYDKKNYTLKLFKDEDRIQKNKIIFHDWNKEHKYILKANYIDSSVCRNLVCANIWSEMVECREGYHPRLDDCSNYGATDGFPLALYLNDEFQGLYTFTLHRDDDLFDMEDDQQDAIIVTNIAQSPAAFFKEKATFDDESDWEVEFNGLADDAWAEDKLNALIDFVMTASDETFKEELKEYLDVNSALDYLIAIYSLGLTNNGAKNITLATYDNGVLFFSLCDMENAFGLSADGEEVFSPSKYLPKYTDGEWNSATESLLWDRILKAFYPEICDRYTELREVILTEENICEKVEDVTEPIAEEFYEADLLRYPNKPQITESFEEQIEAYVSERLLLLDEIFLNE